MGFFFVLEYLRYLNLYFLFYSEFFFESEFRDEDTRKADISSREEDRKEAQRDKANNKGRNKSKTNKRDSSENKPLLGKCTEDLLGGNGTDDLLGLDLSRSDDSDALLLELAALDFGHVSSVPEESTDSCTTNDLLVQQESFLANFDQIFGSTKPESEGDWNSFLPSHFLDSNFVDDSSLLHSNTSTSSLLPSTTSKEYNEKKSTSEATSKKVLLLISKCFKYVIIYLITFTDDGKGYVFVV